VFILPSNIKGKFREPMANFRFLIIPKKRWQSVPLLGNRSSVLKIEFSLEREPLRRGYEVVQLYSDGFTQGCSAPSLCA
jgi:hypothetical protein